MHHQHSVLNLNAFKFCSCIGSRLSRDWLITKNGSFKAQMSTCFEDLVLRLYFCKSTFIVSIKWLNIRENKFILYSKCFQEDILSSQQLADSLSYRAIFLGKPKWMRKTQFPCNNFSWKYFWTCMYQIVNALLFISTTLYEIMRRLGTWKKYRIGMIFRSQVGRYTTEIYRELVWQARLFNFTYNFSFITTKLKIFTI